MAEAVSNYLTLQKMRLPKETFAKARPLIGSVIRKYLPAAFKKQLMNPATEHPEPLFPQEPFHGADLGSILGLHATDFESAANKPNAGLLLLREVGRGQELERVKKKILAGEFDEELKRLPAIHSNSA